MPSASEGLAPAVEVADLSVQYRTNFEKSPTLKAFLARPGRRRGTRVIQALDDVSFTVPSGSVLGIIGANGAGKSTLLRAIAGIVPPSTGRIVVRGEISTLLALGIGFNKALSGRENIALGGFAAGLDPDGIQARFDEIVDFADIGEFIDLPMKTYSSGMYGRLAFAVAAHMNPDVLLIDEALATGDAAFRKKCTQKMDDLCRHAGTILLVSHGLASIRELAERCLWLHKGKVKAYGETAAVTEQYTEYMRVGSTSRSAWEEI